MLKKLLYAFALIFLAGSTVCADDLQTGSFILPESGHFSADAGTSSFAESADSIDIRKWRIISFAADLALSAGLITYGGCSISRGDISSQYTGLVSLTAGTAGALLGTINLKPFRLENQIP